MIKWMWRIVCLFAGHRWLVIGERLWIEEYVMRHECRRCGKRVSIRKPWMED